MSDYLGNHQMKADFGAQARHPSTIHSVKQKTHLAWFMCVSVCVCTSRASCFRSEKVTADVDCDYQGAEVVVFWYLISTHTHKHIHDVMRRALAGMEGRQSHCNYRERPGTGDGWLSVRHTNTQWTLLREKARERQRRENKKDEEREGTLLFFPWVSTIFIYCMYEWDFLIFFQRIGTMTE